MPHHPFPEITHIDDLSGALAGARNIPVTTRAIPGTDIEYHSVKYLWVDADMFPDDGSDLAIARKECRGIIFASNGAILARRFHKFFNVGERESTKPRNVDWSRPHAILDKEDGSMLSPFAAREDGSIVWGTMRGATDISAQAEEFIASSPSITMNSPGK